MRLVWIVNASLRLLQHTEKSSHAAVYRFTWMSLVSHHMLALLSE